VVNVPPPHCAVEVVATVKPAGSVSDTATPLKATPAFGFVIVKVSVVVPATGIVAAPNAFVIVGGASTVSVAVFEVVPVPPFVEETFPVVLFFTPAVAPVTVTLKVQFPPAAIVPPVNAITPVPAVVVNVPPPHCAVEVVATVKPAGSVSDTATPLNAMLVFGFVIVKVSVVVPATGIVAAPNAFMIVGGASTVSVRVAGVLFAPPLVVNAPAGIVFTYAPSTTPIT